MFFGFQIVLELFTDVLLFLVWWYSRGFFEMVIMLKDFLSEKEKSLAFLVWVKNIFRPMYGQYNIPGMIISFLVRTFQIIVRGTILLFWSILAAFFLCAWVVLPVLVVYEIIYQIF